MSILKYINKNGEVVAVNSYKINNVIVSQQKGESTADVMSQKAVTNELNSKADKTEIPTKVSQLTNDSGYLTEHQNISHLATKSEVTTALNDKLDKSTYNTDKPTFATKTESDKKYQVKGDYITYKASESYTGFYEIATPENFIIDAGEY